MTATGCIVGDFTFSVSVRPPPLLSRAEHIAREAIGHYDLNANLLFNWKKKYGTEVALVPVEIVPDSDHGLPESSSHRLNDYGTPSVERNASDFLEIELPCRAKVRCGSDFNSVLLIEALAALRTKP